MAAPRSPATGVHTNQRQHSITDLIRRKIIANEYKSGEHLQEIPLGKELGVSRTPVREALVVLGQEGLVTYRPHRGYVVREFTLPEVLDAYEVRGTLEGLACRLVAERGIDEPKRRVLRGYLEEGDRILSAGELVDAGFLPWRDMNNNFHDRLLAFAQNSTLVDLVGRVTSMPMVSSRLVHWFNYELIVQSHRAHYQIFEAVCARQGTRAEALMREHIHHSTVMIRQNYELLFKKSPE